MGLSLKTTVLIAMIGWSMRGLIVEKDMRKEWEERKGGGKREMENGKSKKGGKLGGGMKLKSFWFKDEKHFNT